MANDEWTAGYEQGVEDAHRCVAASEQCAHDELDRMIHELCSIFHAATMGVGNDTIADMARRALHVFAPDLPATKQEEIKVTDHILEKLKMRVREDERESCAVAASGAASVIHAAEIIRSRGRQ